MPPARVDPALRPRLEAERERRAPHTGEHGRGHHPAVDVPDSLHEDPRYRKHRQQPELRGVKVEELAQTTWENACRLFGLPA